MEPTEKKKLTRLSYLVEIRDGKLLIGARKRMAEDIAAIRDTEFCRLVIEPETNPKTHRQLRGFFGVLVPTVQAHIMATEGRYLSVDRIEDELKRMFLKPVPQYYNDGSPVMIKLKHPERKGVFYDWHFEKIPGLSELSLEQMRSFMDEIIAHYYLQGLVIEIDPEKADPKYKD